MTKSIITYASNLPDWWPNISRPRIVEYANRIGAKFHEVTGEWKGVVSRGEVIAAKLKEITHGQAMILDADVIVSRECPDFTTVRPWAAVHMALDSPPGDEWSVNRLADIVALQAMNRGVRWHRHYGNAGVVIQPVGYHEIWRNWRDYAPEMWPDQANLNYMIRALGTDPEILPRAWNSFGLNNGFDIGQSIDPLAVCKDAYIVHAAGITDRGSALDIFNQLVP